MMFSIALHLLCRCVVVWNRMHVKDVMKQVKYRGPPLLFTMHLCLVGSKSMNFDIQWLEKHAKVIGKRQKAAEAAIGAGPSPAFTCTSLLK